MIMSIKEKIKDITFSEWILFGFLLLGGGFNEYICCAAAFILCCVLIVKTVGKKEFVFRVNLVSVSVVVITLGYLVSTFYAVDSGMAFTGFLKFLPVALYMVLLMQDEGERERVIGRLPYFALILGLLSLAAVFIPALEKYFVSQERMAGFFQYPNTFAMFLLIGELVILCREKYRARDIAAASALVILMLFTGSRAVFVLAALSNILILFLRRGRKTKLIMLGAVALLAVISAVCLPMIMKSEVFSRYFTISFNDNSFICRLLYYRDGIPVILKHPFGLGYMGYYYTEQSFQTGIYYIKNIHNDFLQLALDIGWVPCALFIAGIVKSFFSKRIKAPRKIILLVTVLHALFDFDLQFGAMFCILLLFSDTECGKVFSLSKTAVNTASALLATLSLYFSVALGLSYFGAFSFADYMFPANTQNKISLMISENNIESQAKLADEIIKNNSYVQIAYGAKAKQAFSHGDIGDFIVYYKKVFEVAPFSYNEYEEYSRMLIDAIKLYERAGDEYSANYCKKELVSARDALRALPERQSLLGKKIANKVRTELPEDICEYIENIE